MWSSQKVHQHSHPPLTSGADPPGQLSGYVQTRRSADPFPCVTRLTRAVVSRVSIPLLCSPLCSHVSQVGQVRGIDRSDPPVVPARSISSPLSTAFQAAGYCSESAVVYGSGRQEVRGYISQCSRSLPLSSASASLDKNAEYAAMRWGLCLECPFCSCGAFGARTFSHDRLVGLLVKVSSSGAEHPWFESRLHRDFPASSHTSDFKIGTPVATLPGAWR